MKNNYGLSESELEKIKVRDPNCVYCKKVLLEHIAHNPRSNWRTIEHLNYLPPWSNPKTVVMCCWSCNSSRGNKKLRSWFKTKYCLERNISDNTVPVVVKQYILQVEDKE
jgi:hypothetical protein